MNIIEKINRIDKLFNRSVQEHELEMMACLDEQVTKSYFIRKLSGAFEPDWFEFAVREGIISFSDIPEVLSSEDSDGKITLGFKNWEGAFPIVEAAKALSIFPKLTGLLLNVINKFIVLARERQGDDTRNFTVDYHIAKSILLLPISLLEDRHLEFVFEFGLKRDRSLLSREMVSSFFPRALEANKELSMHLLDRFFTPIFEKRLHRAHSVIDDYTLENFSKTAPEMLYESLGDAVVDWSVDKLKSVSEKHKFMFSKIELTSLEPDPQNSNESNLNFSLTRLVIELLSKIPKDKLGEQLPVFIKLDDHIISRIAYYLIDRNYKEFSYLFWKQENPLNKFEAKLEIYRLIRRHCEDFSTVEVNIIIMWIGGLQVERSENESEEQHEKYKAYRQLEWYLALELIHYKYSEQLIQPYNKLREITEGSQPSHPGYDSYFTVSSAGDFSSSNRILGRSAVDVLNLLANKDKWDGYNIYGLQQDLREYVVTSQAEVMKHLYKFEALPIPFIYNFFDGFRGMAEKAATMDISRLLNFVRILVENRADLWDLSSDARDKSGSVGMIAWTLRTLVRNNDYSITVDQIKNAIYSLIVMEAKYNGAFEWLHNEPVSVIMNSSRGQIYDAMIACSIREVKVVGGEPFWDEGVKHVFTRRLTEKSGSVEFYWSLGFKVPEISYLDMEWLESYKELLIEVKDGKYKLPVFYGYLLFSGQLYTNLYKLFCPTYLSQIDEVIENVTIVRRLVEHIWVAFAIDLEKSNSLLNRVIESADIQKLVFLIDRIKIEDTLNMDEKTRFVWEEILSIAEVSKNRHLKEKAFEMVYFAELLRDFSMPDLDLFNRTISLEKADVNTYRLLKIVEAKLRNKNYEMAGQLLMIVLQKISADAFFDEGKLTEIIEDLYKNGKAEYADRIAIDAVARRNFSAIRIYNKYHNNSASN
jgi:hypothetical protein